MKWNKQRIVAVGVLALAGGAFGVDRFILGYGPDTVPPIETTAQIIAEAPKAAAPENKPAAIVRTVTLSQRVGRIGVEVLADGRALDALAVPVSWRPQIAPAALEPKDVVVEKPAENPKMSVTMIFAASDPVRMRARINGSLVPIGARVDGCTFLGVATTPYKSHYAVLSGPAGLICAPLETADNVRADVAEPVQRD